MLSQHPIRKLVLFCKMGYKCNSTLDTIIYPFRLKYHFIITSPDKFHLSCIIFAGAEGGLDSEILELPWEGKKF